MPKIIKKSAPCIKDLGKKKKEKEKQMEINSSY
jgi:hypothetical protein